MRRIRQRLAPLGVIALSTLALGGLTKLKPGTGIDSKLSASRDTWTLFAANETNRAVSESIEVPFCGRADVWVLPDGDACNPDPHRACRRFGYSPHPFGSGFQATIDRICNPSTFLHGAEAPSLNP